ncbi:MAG TPA: MBL fold metallo-hydrolase [Gammaproteobacteria bacterium]|nr:MBL fold metallo-hydrolase [Gammaproteobacteria bacterium]
MHRVALGGIELTVLDDGVFSFPAKPFFRNVPESEWHDEVGADAEGRIRVGHNCGLVDLGGELIVVDTGYGDDTHGGAAGHLLEELDRAGRKREDVTLVVNTHAHGDHVKRNTIVEDGRRRPTFPRARYHLGVADRQWFAGRRGLVHEFDEQIGSIEALGQLALVDGEHALTPEALIHPTPGHTPGHASLIVESQGQTAIFLGDLCHHPLHFSHPDWVSEFDTDPEVTPRTRAMLFELAVERDALLVCAHAAPPGLGRLERANGGFVWEPVEIGV